MATRHYHVFGSCTPGCLPDNNSIAATLREAKASLEFERQSADDCFFFDSDGKRTNVKRQGSVRKGYYVYTDRESYGFYYETLIDPCDSPMCDLEEEF